MLAIGLMSGTSMDGIDAALIETDGETDINLIAHTTLDYDLHFQRQLKETESLISKANGIFSVDQDFINQSTLLHAEVVQQLLTKANKKKSQIAVIGYHGQTLYHAPQRKISLQIGNGQCLADHTGINVVNDFRSNDIHYGGQGAPLAPLYHQALAIRDNKLPLAVVNCGGIANVTLITGSTLNDLIGFDTGPGNVLIDRWVRLQRPPLMMDKNGAFGLAGKVCEDMLAKLYKRSIKRADYFSKPPPKSLDSHDLQLIPELNTLSFEDACATLEAFTADTIVKSLALMKAQLNKFPSLFVLAGGGWSNQKIKNELIQRLRTLQLPNLQVVLADDMGWCSKSLEAEMFAYFAVRSLQNKILSVPNTTGVKQPVSGGKHYQPNLSFVVS